MQTRSGPAISTISGYDGTISVRLTGGAAGPASSLRLAQGRLEIGGDGVGDGRHLVLALGVLGHLLHDLLGRAAPRLPAARRTGHLATELIRHVVLLLGIGPRRT